MDIHVIATVNAVGAGWDGVSEISIIFRKEAYGTGLQQCRCLQPILLVSPKLCVRVRASEYRGRGGVLLAVHALVVEP